MPIRIQQDFSLENFHPWCGAKGTFMRLQCCPEAFTFIEQYLEQWSENEPLSLQQINDFLWFDAEEMLIEANIWQAE